MAEGSAAIRSLFEALMANHPSRDGSGERLASYWASGTLGLGKEGTECVHCAHHRALSICSGPSDSWHCAIGQFCTLADRSGVSLKNIGSWASVM